MSTIFWIIVVLVSLSLLGWKIRSQMRAEKEAHQRWDRKQDNILKKLRPRRLGQPAPPLQEQERLNSLSMKIDIWKEIELAGYKTPGSGRMDIEDGNPVFIGVDGERTKMSLKRRVVKLPIPPWVEASFNAGYEDPAYCTASSELVSNWMWEDEAKSTVADFVVECRKLGLLD